MQPIPSDGSELTKSPRNFMSVEIIVVKELFFKRAFTVRCLLSVYKCISHYANREAGGLHVPTCFGH